MQSPPLDYPLNRDAARNDADTKVAMQLAQNGREPDSSSKTTALTIVDLLRRLNEDKPITDEMIREACHGITRPTKA